MSKKIRIGECTRCGKCCEGVGIVLEDAQCPEMDDYLRWAALHHDVRVIRINGMVSIRLMRPCQHLERDDDGKAKCGIYENRPKVCEAFPADEIAANECPGYRYEDS
jgi:Fe-S-cluster containining protein